MKAAGGGRLQKLVFTSYLSNRPEGTIPLRGNDDVSDLELVLEDIYVSCDGLRLA